MDKPKDVHLVEITEENLDAILKLKTVKAQEKFVAPNSVSLSQAHFNKSAWYRAIYHNDNAIGFVMLSIDHHKPEYYIWRFMIDERHQGKGYGFKTLQLVIEYVRQFPQAHSLLLSYTPGKGNPSGFYKKLGFVETGEWDEDERIMKLDLYTQSIS